MNYGLISDFRGYEISFKEGITCLATGFTGLAYSKRHWNLSNKCTSSSFLGHRFLAVLEALPLLGGTIALIEKIAVCHFARFFYSKKETPTKIDQKFKKELSPTQQEQNIKFYSDLHLKALRFTHLTPDELKEIDDLVSCSLFIEDKKQQKEQKLLKSLGNGGSKMAIEIEDGRALMVPNPGPDSITEVTGRWERMVEEEVAASDFLKEIGLLSPLSERVSIKHTNEEDQAISAYVCKSFKQFAEEGCFIIDLKEAKSSTWNAKSPKFFANDEQRLDQKNWDLFYNDFLNDVVKICLYNLPYSGDPFNLAINQEGAKNSLQYHLRYFGFDFSSKYRAHESFRADTKFLTSLKIEQRAPLKSAISSMIKQALYSTFDREFKNLKNQEVKDLRAHLFKHYTEEVWERLMKDLRAN